MAGGGTGARHARIRSARPFAALRRDDGSAVVEFPLVAILILAVAVMVIQAALILHTRNTLIDASVQGAHHAALVGNAPEDGATRAEVLVQERFGSGLDVSATASQTEGGLIRVDITGTMPLIGLYGPSGTLNVSGRAIDEESW